MKPIILLLALALVACAPEKGDRGLNGEHGENGESGERGPKGDSNVGDPGIDGQNGTDGTQVTIVKLCPGETTYPSTFVEVALCIEGKLYAVYSTHGGFMTEVPPGSYSSNAVGSKCDFIVGPNCQVDAQ